MTSTSAGSVMSAATTLEMRSGIRGNLFGVELRPQIGPGNRTISREREQHPRLVEVMQAHGAEELADRRDEQDQPAVLALNAWVKMTGRIRPRRRHRVRVLNCEQECQQQDPATDRRVEDRLPDATCRAVGRALGLLGEVGRGIEPGDGVLRQQEAETGRTWNKIPEASPLPPSSQCRPSCSRAS